MWNLLRGIGVPPAYVAAARGVVEAMALAGIVALLDWLGTADLGDWQWIIPLLVFAVRQAEGIADGIDPEK